MSESYQLTRAQRDDLRTIAAMIVPASDEYKVPGADDPAIQADVLATLGRDTKLVVAALDHLARLAAQPLAELDAARRDAVAQERLDAARLQAIIQVEAQKILAQAQSQQPPQGGAPQLGPGPTPGPAAAEQDMYAQERGANPSGPSTASPAPATGTGGEPMPPGMAPPAGLPPVPGPSDTMMNPPVGAVARAAVDEFRDIAKIPHGHKILVGGPVITDDRLGPHTVEVFLTDMNDKATIVNHITNTAQELHGCMDFFEGDPVGPYIDATPGSAGYDVQGKPGEEPLSGEMIPPEMAGMAGAGPEGAPAAPPMMQGA